MSQQSFDKKGSLAKGKSSDDDNPLKGDKKLTQIIKKGGSDDLETRKERIERIERKDK